MQMNVEHNASTFIDVLPKTPNCGCDAELRVKCKQFVCALALSVF